MIDLGIIGGSGLYEIPGLEILEERKVYTPFGSPSDVITVGEMNGRKIAFLPRHGRGHRFPPHRVNYRANIWAMKELGVKFLLGLNAVGSLKEDLKPGDFVVPDQFIDMTKGRPSTFYEEGTVVHVSVAEPFCQHLRKLVLKAGTSVKGLRIHNGGTYICIEGPRFSTRAESRVWREVFRADVIGMTLVPEAVLACEAELCYANVSMITDYDVWKEEPVTAEEVIRVMEENTRKAKELIKELVRILPEEVDRNRFSCAGAVEKGKI